MKIIVTPLYYIDNVLETELDGATAIIVTDDVSPIFPLERRMEWFNKTFVGNDILLESVVQNDESEEFLEAVTKKIDAVASNNVYKLVFFSTEQAHENLKDFGDVKHIQESPLELDKGKLNKVFYARFGKEFNSYLVPKVKELPYNEEHNIIPFFTLDDERYFGVIDNYTTEKLEMLNIETPYMPTVAVLNKSIDLWTDKFFGGKVISRKLLGSIRDIQTWAVEIDKPEWFSTDAEKNRKMVGAEVDIVFIKDKFFKVSQPEFSWVYMSLLELEEASSEIPEELTN